MKHVVSAALAAASLASPLLHAQTTTPAFTDPANLAGERARPRDGRELAIDQGTRGLQQMMRRLNTRASVLNIVAHPDDEDGGMLTFYARGMGAQVADLSLTRGEGGQNAMTGDFEDALGLLRTQELLANDRYVGISQMFGTEVDFGFSKTKTETFGKWTHERVLYDAVRAIRIFRPLVITSTWVGGVTDGHGQHQVSGEIAQEAFVAAGDPKVFPEMEQEGIYPWKALRVYARVPHESVSGKGLYDYATNQFVPAEFHNYVTGKQSTEPFSTDSIVPEGQVDPLFSAQGEAPLSYLQLARLGLREQKSQVGPGLQMPSSGPHDVPFHLFGSRICSDAQALADCLLPGGQGSTQDSASFFHGIDTTLPGISSLAPDAPSTLRLNLRRAADLIAQAENRTQNGETENISTLLQQSAQAIDAALAGVQEASISREQKVNASHELRVKRAQLEEALALALQVQWTATTPAASAGLIAGAPFTITSQFTATPMNYGPAGLTGSVKTQNTNAPTATAGAQKLAIGEEEAQRFKPTLPYFHRANVEQPYYDLTDPALRNAPLAPAPLIVQSFAAESTLPLTLIVNAEGSKQPIQFLPSDEATRAQIRTVGYGDLPRTNYIPQPTKFGAPTGLQLPKRRRIAYLAGTGDSVPRALVAMGLTATVMPPSDVTLEKLSAYDSVILGVRTYAAHPELHGAPTQALLQYARRGGNVIVQYQSEEYTAADAPFPLSLGSGEKVVDENAPVVLLHRENSLLRVPNKITEADFNGWIEERGHSFMASWAPQYTALTETHDPGAAAEHILPQKPQRGGLLTANVGKGHYTYVAFALYRQFPEGVPGAYRLLANLLSLGQP